MSWGSEVVPVLGFFTGHWEILVIGGVIVLVFFGSRIPAIMRSLGKGVTQFKKGLKEGKEDEDASEGEGGRDVDAKKGDAEG